MARKPTLSDSQLIARVSQSDSEAFEQVYDRYRTQAFGLAMRITRHHAMAEEVVQDAFVNLWRGAPGYDASRASLGTWLLSCVRYRAIDSLRSARRHERNLTMEDAGIETFVAPGQTDAQVLALEDSRDTRRVVADLPGDQREVIELAYFRGLTQAEIAERTQVPLGTVKGRSRLALGKLRQALGAEAPLASA